MLGQQQCLYQGLPDAVFRDAKAIIVVFVEYSALPNEILSGSCKAQKFPFGLEVGERALAASVTMNGDLLHTFIPTEMREIIHRRILFKP